MTPYGIVQYPISTRPGFYVVAPTYPPSITVVGNSISGKVLLAGQTVIMIQCKSWQNYQAEWGFIETETGYDGVFEFRPSEQPYVEAREPASVALNWIARQAGNTVLRYRPAQVLEVFATSLRVMDFWSQIPQIVSISPLVEYSFRPDDMVLIRCYPPPIYEAIGWWQDAPIKDLKIVSYTTDTVMEGQGANIDLVAINGQDPIFWENITPPKYSIQFTGANNDLGWVLRTQDPITENSFSYADRTAAGVFGSTFSAPTIQYGDTAGSDNYNSKKGRITVYTDPAPGGPAQEIDYIEINYISRTMWEYSKNTPGLFPDDPTGKTIHPKPGKYYALIICIARRFSAGEIVLVSAENPAGIVAPYLGTYEIPGLGNFGYFGWVDPGVFALNNARFEGPEILRRDAIAIVDNPLWSA